MKHKLSNLQLIYNDKLGRKDVLKIEDRELVQEELDRLAIIAPEASIAIIRNYSVAEKRRIGLSEKLINIIRIFKKTIRLDISMPKLMGS